MKFQAEGKKPVLHGIKVGIGMIIVTKMYEMLEQEHFNFTSLKERSFDYAAWEKKSTIAIRMQPLASLL